MKMPGVKYGCSHGGVRIEPKSGERILKEGEPLPEVHRPWINGSGWQGLTTFVHKHPGANRIAQVFGNYWCYAAPIENHVSEPQAIEADPSEEVLDVPSVVSEPTVVPAKPKKRKCLPHMTTEIEFE